MPFGESLSFTLLAHKFVEIISRFVIGPKVRNEKV